MAYRKSEKGNLLLFIFILAGIVIGSFLGNLATNVDFLSWLNYGHRFGMTEPFGLDIKVLYLQFRFMFDINIASVIGIIIGVFVYRKL